MELANIILHIVINNIEDYSFILKDRISKRLLHDDYFNESFELNFRKGEYNAMDR